MTAFLEEAYLECEKANLAYETFCKYTDLADRAYKVKMYTEEADLYPGLDSIYLEAQEASKPSADPKVQEQKKGLLARAWDKIVSFFRKISDIIFGKKIDELRGVKEVEVDKDVMDLADDNNKLLSALSGKKKGIFLGAAGIAAIIGTGCFIIKKLQGYSEDAKNAAAQAAEQAAEAAAKAKDEAKSKVKVKVSGDAIVKVYNNLKAQYAKMADIVANEYRVDNKPMSAAERLKFDKDMKNLESKIMKYNDIMAGKLGEQLSAEKWENMIPSLLAKVGNAIKKVPQMVKIVDNESSGNSGINTKHRNIRVANAT